MSWQLCVLIGLVVVLFPLLIVTDILGILFDDDPDEGKLK